MRSAVGPGFEYDDATHEYFVGGRSYVSITQALEWTGLRPPFYRDPETYRHRGKAVHRATELWDLGTLDEGSAVDVAGWLDGWKAYRNEWDFVPVRVERPGYSKTWRFAGTSDRVGKIRGGIWAITDVKSVGGAAKKPEPWVAFQTAGQEVLALEDEDLVAQGIEDGAIRRFAVVLGPDGSHKVEEYRSRGDRNRFLAAVTVCNTRLELFGQFRPATT
jgi:hypothetical protein